MYMVICYVKDFIPFLDFLGISFYLYAFRDNIYEKAQEMALSNYLYGVN